MKLYDWAAAPNPKRLRMFLVEKGLKVETVQVAGDGFVLTPEYKAKYPHAMVPMLELDDGRQIGESIAICRYFEELHPNPPMLGRDPYERAIVDMWERRAFDQGMTAVAEMFRNSNPYFKDRGLAGFADPVPQLPQLVDRGRASLENSSSGSTSNWARADSSPPMCSRWPIALCTAASSSLAGCRSAFPTTARTSNAGGVK